ncbi:MAG: hypothetical protein AB3N33_04290 [Puniceicoccaceae bacterium]
MKTINLKTDLKETAERFQTWWNCEETDRPVLELAIKPETEPTIPVSNHSSLRERWLDVDYQVDLALARLRAGVYVAETLPVFMPDIGPDLTSTFFGEQIEFGENTSWALHRIADVDDWEQLVDARANFDNLYWQTLVRMTERALALGGDDILVGMPDFHGAFDTMVSMRGPEGVCLDLMEEPELVVGVAENISREFNKAVAKSWEMLKSAGQGSTTWCHFYHEDLAYIPSCDFWCLISPEMAQKHVVQTIEMETRPLTASIFHLDGPDALRHLDWVLESDLFNAVQWVFGAGQGDAKDWVHIFRKIRDAGKSFQAYANSPDDALELISKVGKQGAWITLANPLENRAEAEAFIRAMEAL